MSVALAIPVHNRLYFTVRCLESFAQYTDFSLVTYVAILDDRSSDGTEEYAREFAKDHGFKYYRRAYMGAWGGFDSILPAVMKNNRIRFIGKVDNDVLFTGEWIGKIIAEFNSDARLGSIRYGMNGSLGRSIGIEKGGDSGFHGGLKIFRKEFVVPVGKEGRAGSTPISQNIIKSGLVCGKMEVGLVDLTTKYPELSQRYIEKRWQR